MHGMGSYSAYLAQSGIGPGLLSVIPFRALERHVYPTLILPNCAATMIFDPLLLLITFLGLSNKLMADVCINHQMCEYKYVTFNF